MRFARSLFGLDVVLALDGPHVTRTGIMVAFHRSITIYIETSADHHIDRYETIQDLKHLDPGGPGGPSHSR